MNLPLVVGVDGSEPSLQAVDWAADEATLHGLPLHVVFASLWERYEGAALARSLGKPSALLRAEDIVRAAARRARNRRPDVQVTTAVVPEEAEYALARAGREAFGLVVGNRGRSGLAGLLLGSVSLTLAAGATCPVIVIRGSHGSGALAGRQGRIVVGVGEAPAAALRFAYAEARLRAVPLEAVRAWRCPAHETVDHPLLTGEPARLYEERAAKELEAALADAPRDVDLRRRTAEGPARSVLPAASREAALLIVGRRRPGQFEPQLGRVAYTVLHHAACPVVVVPEQV
ncbi:universal stress protein [Streptomyces sp. TRM S81-3]|uniref:Universal stress protein n=1 Tax=Streptomyces griseicoloratus TaxID=2752516 RepID=A0A926QTC1_9ACTN|nr:universal stress protein [Streptomyces griseicoloratus]MBD0422725.1 universal stress protein [Streptomyces griseicoloratus]